MGEVVNTLKVMPESPEVDLEALKAAITDAMPADAELHEKQQSLMQCLQMQNYTKLLKNLLHSV